MIQLTDWLIDQGLAYYVDIEGIWESYAGVSHTSQAAMLSGSQTKLTPKQS